MSLQQGTSNQYECDGCGADLGNGGVTVCSILSMMDPDRPGEIINLHYCYDREEKQSKAKNAKPVTVKGCTNKIWSKGVSRRIRERRVESTE